MNKKTIILISILALIAGLLLGLKLFLTQKPPLQIISVIPENQAKNISTEKLEVKIDFNRQLKNQKEVKIDFFPQIKTTIFSFENEQKDLIITSQEPLQPNTTYFFEVKDKKDKTLWQSSFTTEKLAGDPLIPYQDEQNTQKNYPLLEFIPYETEKFSVAYSGPLMLEVKVKKGDKKEIKQAVLDWISEKGVDPQTHQIKWVTPHQNGAGLIPEF